MTNRFNISQYSDGQICINDNNKGLYHIQINGNDEAEVQLMSNQRITLDKLFGPLIFWPIRIVPDASTCEWIIEREFGNTGYHINSNGIKCEESEWREVARIPGQLDRDFSQ